MDILTARGQETLVQEREAASLFCSAFKGYGYVSTPKDEPCIIDALLIKDLELKAVAETKCRQMTLGTFVRTFNSEWLVTWHKLQGASHIAGLLCVPLYGFLYLVPSRTLLIRRLWDHVTGWAVPMRVEDTVTQATVNGGTALRTNAFIDMSDAKQVIASP